LFFPALFLDPPLFLAAYLFTPLFFPALFIDPPLFFPAHFLAPLLFPPLIIVHISAPLLER
jgi:hypothetical protein